MTIEQKQEIANSFTVFASFDMDIEISVKEFDIFEKGVYAKSMDEKWNIFVLGNFMYWCRSWTGYCIYKIQLERKGDVVKLNNGFVTRNKTQYDSEDVEKDKITFLRTLQIHLHRYDLYVDPEFDFDLIKQIIKANNPSGIGRKSIGHDTAGVTRQIYNSLIAEGQKHYFEIFGWDELKQNIAEINDNEPLLTLTINHIGATFFFDKEGKVLLGQISMKSKLKA